MPRGPETKDSFVGALLGLVEVDGVDGGMM